MSAPEIRFDDGAAYEQFMGSWSRPVGETFLDWLAPTPGLAWADIGCGNGVSSALICRRCAPALVEGIDPSEAQLAFARTRADAGAARFRQGDAMALPFEDARFDIAMMALVIFFVPDPARGVAEMRRVTRPGGMVAAYAWDVPGGGVPYDSFWVAMRAMGLTPAMPPRPEVSTPDGLRQLWVDGGLVDLAARTITLTRTFEHFDAYWQAALTSSSLRDAVAALTPADQARLRDAVRDQLVALPGGAVQVTGRASAIRGRVP